MDRVPRGLLLTAALGVTVAVGLLSNDTRLAILLALWEGYDAHAAETAHGEVGRAMVYTTVIITLGFSILTLSNFMPTVYFGLLTGLAMVFALVSNLALLPLLLERLRPFVAR